MVICTVAELIFKRYCEQFIAALAKLRKGTISFVTSVCPSVCSHEIIRLPMAGFNEISYLRIFRNYVEKTEVLLKSDKNIGYFTRKPIYIYDAELVLE